MRWLALALLCSCSVYESLPYTGLEGIATQMGSDLTLHDGRKIHVDVIYGARIQAFSEISLEPDNGVCGLWQPERPRIVIAQVASCGDIYPTLLHELGHAYGMPHGHGIMWHGYEGPVSEQELAEFRAALPHQTNKEHYQ